MSLVSIVRNRRNGDCADVLPVVHGRPGRDIVLSAYFRRKAVLDRVLAAILLVPGLPLIGLLVLLVRMTSRGPGIYQQTRVGKGGGLFLMNKIRTMSIDAETRTGPVWTQVGDPRITRLGRVLRKLHLDELPQLFNVLRGEMSLIGPRPERPEFVRILAESIPGYLDRLAVCPGITGLAQINLDPDTDLESVRRKLVLDIEYIMTAGLFLDIRMLLCTSLRLMNLKGHVAKRLTGMHRDVPRQSPKDATGDGKESMPLDAPPTPASIGLRSPNGSDNGEGGSNGHDPAHVHTLHAKRQAKGKVVLGNSRRPR